MKNKKGRYQKELKSYFDIKTQKGIKTVVALALGAGLVGGYVVGHYADNRITGTVATYKNGNIKVSDLYKKLKNNTTGSGIVKSELILETFNNTFGDSVKQEDINKATSFYNLSTNSQNEKELKENTKKQLAFEKGLRERLTVNNKELKEAFSSYQQPVKLRFMVFQDESTATNVENELKQGGDAETLAQDNNSLAGDGSEITYTNAYDYSYKDYSNYLPEDVINSIYQMQSGEVKTIAYDTVSNNDKITYYYVLKVDNITAKSDNWKDYKKDLTQLVKTNKINSDSKAVNKVIKSVFKENKVKVQDEYLKKALKDYTG